MRNKNTVNVLLAALFAMVCCYGYLIYDNLASRNKGPRQVNLVCKINGTDTEKNIVSFTCFQD